MKHLNLQLQPEKAPQLDLAKARALVGAVAEDHAIVAGYQVSEGDDEGPFVNFTFLAKNLGALWAAIREGVLGDPALGRDIARSSIVICEGEKGWEDYRLLHHYDPKLPLEGLDDG